MAFCLQSARMTKGVNDYLTNIMNEIAQQQLAIKILAALPIVSQTITANLRDHPEPIALNQVMVLRTLAERPFNLSNLANEHMVTLPTMSNTISRMVKQGWVTRTRSQEDRRMVLIELTAVGRTRLKSTFQHLADNIATLFSTLSPVERADLERGLSLIEMIFTPKGATQ